MDVIYKDKETESEYPPTINLIFLTICECPIPRRDKKLIQFQKIVPKLLGPASAQPIVLETHMPLSASKKARLIIVPSVFFSGFSGGKGFINNRDNLVPYHTNLLFHEQ